MPRTAVVESDGSMTRRTLKDAGFDDDQAQALVDLTGTAAERRELKANVVGLKQDVVGLKQDVVGLKQDVVEVKQDVVNLRTEMRGGFARLDARVDGLRDEMTARFKGLEGRVDAKFEGLEGRVDARFESMDAKFDGLEGRVDARFDGMEGRMKLMLWMMGSGLTFYVGTTVALLVLLYRSLLV